MNVLILYTANIRCSFQALSERLWFAFSEIRAHTETLSVNMTFSKIFYDILHIPSLVMCWSYSNKRER
jgi:hypothetical protein